MIFYLLCSLPLFSQIEKKIVPPDTSRAVHDSTISKRILPRPDTTAIDTVKWRQDVNIFPALSRHEIDRLLYEDAGDVLTRLPEIFLLDRGSAGQKLLVSFQGNSANQSALFVDGRRFYDPITGEADLNFLPVEFFDSISIGSEFSPLNNGQDGVVHFLSSNYQGQIPISKIFHHKAGLGFSDVDFSFGQRVSKKMNILVGGAIKSSDGKNSAYQYEHENLRAKVAYFLSQKWRLEYAVLQNKINREAPGAFFQNTYRTPSAESNDVRFDHTLNFYGRVFDKKWADVQMTCYYSSFYSKLADDSLSVPSVNRSRYSGANLLLSKAWLGQQFTVGGNIQNDYSDANVVGKHNLIHGNVFLQDDFDIYHHIGLSFSAGCDGHELSAPAFFGGLTGYFNSGKNFKLLTGAKQSNRFPTLFELYARNEFQGNLQLNPETFQKLYAGAEQLLFSKIKFSASFYQKNINHYILIQTSDTTRANFFNSEFLQFWGMEILIDVAVSKKFKLFSLLNFLDNSNLPHLPKMQLNSYLQYQDRFFKQYLSATFRLEGCYYSSRVGEIFDRYQTTSTAVATSAAFILNAQAVLGFDKLVFFLRYENLLDEQYELQAGYPQRGRTFHFGLRWNFLD